MYKKLNILLVFIFLILNLFQAIATEIKYPAWAINDSLKLNALAIVREDLTTVNIKSSNNVVITEKYVVTILKAQGDDYGYKQFSYDNSRSIISLSATLYNAKGEKVESYNRNDFHDFSPDPYGTIATDSRCIESEIYYNKYPYTIEFNVKYNNEYNIYLPNWLPLNHTNMAVERSKYTIIYPPNYKLRYKASNITENIKFDSSETYKSWELNNFSAYKDLNFMPDLRTFSPYVNLEPTEFYYEGYTGNLKSWTEYGKFFSYLNKDRNILPYELKAELDILLDTCTTELSKIKVLYSFMQNNTRYISIQLGIGGQQPMPAELVYKDGYGDCKALSNYMVAMLDYAGVKSYYSLVEAGKGEYYFDTKFVSDQFNHIIVSVPRKNDTLWLECTNQQMPFGFLGDFTDNRPALMITEEGGKLVRTTVYKKEDNQIIRNITISISNDRSAKAESISEYHGLEYDNMHWLGIEDKESQKKLLYKQIEIPDFTINDFKITTTEGPIPVLTEQLDLTIKNFVNTAGSRIFVPVTPVNNWTSVPEKNENRSLPIDKKFDGSYAQTVKILIPENTEVEALPDDALINTEFGSYSRKITQTDKYIICSRKLSITRGVFEAEKYKDFRTFYKTVVKYDDDMLILKKTN